MRTKQILQYLHYKMRIEYTYEGRYKEPFEISLNSIELFNALKYIDEYPWAGYKKLIFNDKDKIIYVFRNSFSGATCVCSTDKIELNGQISQEDRINNKYPQGAIDHVEFINELIN